MLKRFYPDDYVDSAYEIPYEELYKKGYRGIVFDVDNTLVEHGAPVTERAIALFERLRKTGYDTCIISNNKEPRVRPLAEAVHSKYVSDAKKPSPKNYIKAMECMKTDVNTTFFVGDQLFTDVWGANRAGMMTILVKPIDKHEEIQIVLKRIAVCEGFEECNYKEIYNRWFPEKIHGIEPANYILNNSWCKPRDMVRLLSTAKNALQNNSKVFSQAVFNSLSKAYSEESLSEIKEELRALYDPTEIETIINCFMGYKTAFSVSQLKKRISTYYAGTVIDTHFNQVIEDLYRLGFLGNFMPISKIYRWQHKGDERVILADEWRLFVHYALHGALSLGARLNFGLTRGEQPETGDVVNAVVQKVIRSFALVEFTHNGESYLGQIHISEFTKLGYGYIGNLSEIVHIDDEYRTALLDYHEKYERWNLQIIPQELE